VSESSPSSSPPRPRASPKPVAAEFDNPDPDSPNTGVHPATREFVREVNKSGLWHVVYGVGGFAVACLVAGALVTRAVAQEAHDAGVKAAEDVKKEHEARIIALEQQVPQLRQEVFDSRLELRDIYKAVVDKKRSERLEHPPPEPKTVSTDGGR